MSKSADAFRTISEVADWLDTPAHVLRFWESKFTQVKPVKRAGGRRYYRPQDMMLLGGIKKLLHEDGMTIKSVQSLLRQQGVKYVAALSVHPSEGSGYAPNPPEPVEEPQPETSSVVSFKAPEPEPVPEPVAEPEVPVMENDPDVAADPEPQDETNEAPIAAETAPETAAEADDTEAESAKGPGLPEIIAIMDRIDAMDTPEVAARRDALAPVIDDLREAIARRA